MAKPLAKAELKPVGHRVAKVVENVVVLLVLTVKENSVELLVLLELRVDITGSVSMFSRL